MTKGAEIYHDDEITLKELILKLKEFWDELWHFKFWIVVTGLFIGLYMGYSAYSSKPTYTAKQTFMVNNDEGGGIMSGIGGILGSFGLGGGGGGKFNLDKILELSKSRRISQDVLFASIEIGNKEDFLANHIITYKDTIGEWGQKPFYKFWGKESMLKDFRFTSDSLESFDINENSALKSIHGVLVGSEKQAGLINTSYNEESGIMSISVTSENQNLSYFICKILYEKLSNYYVKKTIEKQMFTYKIIKSKYDSLELALSTTQFQLAKFEDKNQRLFSKVDKLKGLKINQEVQKLGLMYGEAAKNLEIADFSLKNKTPFVQEIDAPLLPIKGKKDSLVKGLVIGGFLGAFLCSLFIISRKIFRDTMAES